MSDLGAIAIAFAIAIAAICFSNAWVAVEEAKAQCTTVATAGAECNSEGCER